MIEGGGVAVTDGGVAVTDGGGVAVTDGGAVSEATPSPPPTWDLDEPEEDVSEEGASSKDILSEAISTCEEGDKGLDFLLSLPCLGDAADTFGFSSCTKLLLPASLMFLVASFTSHLATRRKSNSSIRFCENEMVVR